MATAEEGPATTGPERSDFFVVGIGASAGGLEPIQRFFERIPPDLGVAYVVVQHLSPDFKSLMPELLARHTSMPILRVEEATRLRPDHVYLIAQGHDLRLEGGVLTVRHQVRSARPSLPIDIFFASLARWARDRAIAVVLSGTGSDGTRGIQAVKEEGGFVLVHDPEDAEFDGMPRSALATGCADLALPKDDLPERVRSFVEHAESTRGTPTEEPDSGRIRKVLDWLWEHERVDFRGYKISTIQRRIQRRLALLQCPDLNQYLVYLKSHLEEGALLVRELLISVTSLFRDGTAFQLLEERVLPRLIEDAGDSIRVWVPACASGEEAYSLAILIDEQLRLSERNIPFKIFATDINDAALAVAGEGKFHSSIETEISPGRLARYFEAVPDGGYRIRRVIRDTVVFAHHDVLADPPFARMDLVSCRNLLIYLSPNAQSDLLNLLHFSLVEKGVLFLGPSETLGAREDAYEAIDNRWRIYRKLDGGNVPLPLQSRLGGARSRDLSGAGRLSVRGQDTSLLFRRVCAALSEDLGDATFVFGHDGRLCFSFGDTHRFAHVGEGAASLSIKDLFRGELKVAITMGMQGATSESPLSEIGHVRHDPCEHPLDLTVRRLVGAGDANSLFVVTIKELREEAADPESFDANEAANTQIRILERELEVTRENLQAMLEQVETANEELQSTNEELMATNEELQSTNEELQSVNEELYTVNAEHQDKIAELSDLSADMEGLLRSTNVGTVFLDDRLCIRKYTPAAEDLIAILPTDLGRPFQDLSHRLLDVDLHRTVGMVIGSRQMAEQAVQHQDGRSFLLRAIPYELHVGEPTGGVVVTFTDISEIEKAKVDLAEREQLIRELITATDYVFWMATCEPFEVLYCSPAIAEIAGIAAEEVLTDPACWLAAVHEDDRRQVRDALRKGGAMDLSFRIQRQEEERWIRLRSHPIAGASGDTERMAGTAVDITEDRLKDMEMESMLLRLEEQANNDPLTGLLNRRGLEKSLALELDRSRRDGSRVVAVLIDLDDFKGINDRLGHSMGDVVLQQVAQRAERSLRPTDSFARIGGDEFLALLPDTRMAEGLRIAERLRLAVSDSPLVASSEEVKVTASLGVALVPVDAASVEEVVARVQRTLSMSKRGGKNRIASDSPGQGGVDDSASLLARLTEEDCVRALAQEIHSLRDDEVVGYELLSRGPAGPFESPYDLFRVSMDNNILTMMDLKCLRACVRAAEQEHLDGRIHLNLFPSTLLDTPSERLAGLLDAGRDLSRYCIEISEQQFIGDPRYLCEPIASLRESGARIAIDDVGFGRSCLESLIVLEPDVIKIDRSFVSQVDQSAQKQRQLCRMINAAESLGTEVVAEGVETEAELRFLRDNGVRFAQGFFWGKPSASPSRN